MGIRSRIAAEDQMTPPAGGGGVPAGAVAAPPQAGAPPSPTAVSGTPQLAQGKFLNVIATVNLTKQTGKIQHVHPIESAQLGRAEATSSTRVRLLDASGSPLRDEPVELRLGSCPMPGEDQTGLVDAILPFDPGIQVVELLLNGQVIDTFAASPVQPAISNVRAGAAARPGHVALAWDVHHAPASTVSYSVQVSTNEGRTWQTVAVRQPTPTAEINLEQFRPAKKVHVRVIASDGFNTQMTSQQEIQME